jgi:drug/metabolite transporter, DME family
MGGRLVKVADAMEATFDRGGLERHHLDLMTNQADVSEPFDSTATAERNTAIGIVLVLTSAVAWSTAGFFARIVLVDIWVVLFWRSAFGALSILVLALIERRRFAFDWRRAFRPAGIAMMILNGIGMAGFLYALQDTTIANVTVIYATLPFITAIFAWLWFRERAKERTLIGSLIAGVGLAMTVAGTIAIGGGHLSGDLSALGFTTAFALMTVFMRRHREAPMLESVAISGFLMALVALCIRDAFAISFPQSGWLAAFGVVTQGGGLGSTRWGRAGCQPLRPPC